MPGNHADLEILSRVFETSPTGIVVLSPTGEITRSNQRAEEILGLEKDDVVGRSHNDDYWTFQDQDGEPIPESEHPFVRVVEEGPIFNSIYTLELPRREPVLVSISGAPVVGDGGEIDRYVFAFEDVTPQRERERELERLTERMEYALNKTESIIFEIDLDTLEETRNGPFERIFGLERADVDTADAFYQQAVHPEDREHLRAQQMNVIEGEEDAATGEYRTHPDNGDIRWIRASIARTGGATSGSVVGLSTDITPLKQREAELKRQNERLDEFASVVSHDLRNPLTVATGRLELVREEVDHEELELVSSALDRMDTLVEDLLTLARSGEPVGEMEPVALTDVVEECWTTVRSGSAAIDIQATATIRADASRLRQLLENLFRNAIEHGGDEVTIRVGDLPNGFYVEDDGSGIPPGEREAIFDPGYSTDDDGTGFGLSIVRDIVSAHGWTIRVTDADAGGARFVITGVETAA